MFGRELSATAEKSRSGKQNFKKKILQRQYWKEELYWPLKITESIIFAIDIKQNQSQ